MRLITKSSRRTIPASGSIKKQIQTIGLSHRSIDTDNESSIDEIGEELTEIEWDYDTGNEEFSYGTTSKTVHIGDTATNNIIHPLEENFFNISITELAGETSEDTIEKIESYVQSPIEQEVDFFERLGNVPDVKQISDDALRVVTKCSLHGKFVDPLTGVLVGSDDEKELSEEHLEEEKEEEEEVEADKTESSTDFEQFPFEEFDSRFSGLVDKSVVIKSNEEELTFLLVTHETLSDQSVETLPKRRRILTEEVCEQTEKFLNDIVNFAVRFCEQEQGTKLLKKHLDKVALFREIKRVVFEMDIQRKVNSFLNRKCAEYHRRKGNLRHLQDEKPDKFVQDLAAYKEKCELLNFLLGKELEMLKKTNKQIIHLTQKADEEEEEKQLEVSAFENLVRKTMKCQLHPALEKFVSTQLGHMTALREEISATRSVIIKRQHTLGTLRARLHELESIGDGLRLADYENLQREMVALGKKTEDRNRELGKMHGRFNHNLHTMAHIKLKSEVTVGSIDDKLQNLQELEEEENLTRRRLFKMNLTHKSTRRQLADLSLRSGLLDKPALLIDYDETMERLKKQRAKIQELKKSHLELEAKIKHLEIQSNSSLNANNADKSKSLIRKSSIKPIAGFEGICLNF